MERPVRTMVVGLGEKDLRRRDCGGLTFVQEVEGGWVLRVHRLR